MHQQLACFPLILLSLSPLLPSREYGKAESASLLGDIAERVGVAGLQKGRGLPTILKHYTLHGLLEDVTMKMKISLLTLFCSFP